MSWDMEEFQRRHAEWEYRKFPGKPEWLAEQLTQIVARTTAQYEDLPERSPLETVTDLEWRQTLALIQKHREECAAHTVDRFTQSRAAKEARYELSYVLQNHEYAPLDRLPYYLEKLRQAERNFTAVADALEVERARMSEQKVRGMGA